MNGILFVGTKIILLNDIIIRLDLGYMSHSTFVIFKDKNL